MEAVKDSHGAGGEGVGRRRRCKFRFGGGLDADDFFLPLPSLSLAATRWDEVRSLLLELEYVRGADGLVVQLSETSVNPEASSGPTPTTVWLLPSSVLSTLLSATATSVASSRRLSTTPDGESPFRLGGISREAHLEGGATRASDEGRTAS